LVAPSIFAPQGSLRLPEWDRSAYLLAGVIAATTRRMVAALAVRLSVLNISTVLAVR
jgi:hypothetical protein